VIAVDTSVIVAAISPWHEFHDVARAACVDDIISRQWGGKRIDPSAALYASAIGRLAKQGIVGGSTYDGLVALTVLEHGMSLVSLDRRAERTYRRLGVDYRVL